MRQLLILLLLFWPSPLRLLNLVPPFLPKDCFAAAFADQARPLRARERKRRGLDSADSEAPGTARKGIVSFFQAEIAPKKRGKEKCNGKTTTYHLARTTAGCGRNAGPNARS
jgi:hypothetical protein